jgi:Dual specificity phosphatase, catalytic domain
MSAKYSLTFLLLAAAFAMLAANTWDVVGLGTLVFLYPACSCFLMALAYGGLGPDVFLKRANGRLHPLSWLILGPYLGSTALAFFLYRRGSKEAAYAQAVPNLFFGRRLTDREARRTQLLGWIGTLDLTAEFTEIGPLRELPHYRVMPVLDAMAPTRAQLLAAVSWLQETIQLGPVYVHCALGHGRTATVVLAFLLSSRQIATVNEGLALLRSLRPGVGLNEQQSRVLRSFEL